jgi:hypothetical protein
MKRHHLGAARSPVRAFIDQQGTRMAWEKDRARTSDSDSRKSKRAPGAAAMPKPEQRHQLPLPHEMRERQPFGSRTLVAPWPRRRELQGDAGR